MAASVNAGSRDVDFDAIVVGAGFAGIYAVHRLRDQKGLRVRGFERAGDVGGVWYWNRYPGARCDLESLQYSYSFSPDLEREWDWSERYAQQPEILKYLNHVADRLDVRKDFQFDTTVTSMVWNEEGAHWVVGTADGRSQTARFVLACTGSLSIGKELEFPGTETFKGEVYTTHSWPHHKVDLAGKRVGVVGTGSSGVQTICEVAKVAGHLTVFQRTPAYAIPLGDTRLDPADVAAWRSNVQERRYHAREETFGGLITYPPPLPSALAVSAEERKARYDSIMATGGKLHIASFADLLFNDEANATAREYLAEYIARRINDPEVAKLLTPTDYPFGVKRVPLEIGYYDAFNQDNVTLVDVRKAPIQEITENGLRTADADYDLDVIIFATGFDAFTGALAGMGIVGRDGVRLTDKWAHGPQTYLGIATQGFPNLFMITGPESPSVFYVMPLAVEDHINFASEAIDYMQANGYAAIDPEAKAEADWHTTTADIMSQTLLPKANSWYMGANVPGKPRTAMIYLGGGAKYRKICNDAAANGYEGFQLTKELEGEVVSTTSARV